MRKAGILLHPTSLPSKEGIGTLGNEAYRFIDFLKKSNQKIWQIFPLGPTGYGDSPYQCFSAFAGNPYLIDLETLVDLGYLSEEELNLDFGDNKEKIDYGKIYLNKMPLLKKAFSKFNVSSEEFLKFNNENSYWLDNYSLFMAIKNRFNGMSWIEWPKELKNREKDAIDRCSLELKDEINYQKFLQYMFYTQWFNLKKYANDNGIEIIGDIPIFVSMDSSDTWSNTKIFQFNDRKQPKKVAGVPPDYFSETGQLWGNPLFDWDEIKKDNYLWWINRIKANLNLFDIIRIDHFRGFESYWSIDSDAKTAIEGKWEKGPGIEFFNKIKEKLGNISIIAEDLGILTDKVIELKKEANLPGMKILQFAFDGTAENLYLPHNYEKNCVVYTGTHDNDTTKSWFESLSYEEKSYVKNYLNITDESYLTYSLIRLALRSIANICIIPMQDYLNLGKESRMNTPGKADNNWQWRMLDNTLTEELSNNIKNLTILYGRSLKK